MLSDDQLMIAYQKGETSAFEALVMRYRRQVFGFLRRLIKDDGLAEDVMLDTFFKVHRSAATYEPKGQFRTFLFRVAYNLGLNALRDGRRWRGLASIDAVEEGAGPASGYQLELADPADGPEALLQSRQTVARLQRGIAELPEVQRAVFLLYYQDGLQTGEIAEVVGVPSGSVRAWLSMARKTLREMLDEQPPPDVRPSMRG